MIKIEHKLTPTDIRHADMVDAWAYMIASQEIKLIDSYYLLYIKNKPKWMPKFFYNWCIKNLINTSRFM